jgi:septum formation protein
MRLILASTSPRRRDLLSLLGVPFEVVAPDVAETSEGAAAPADQVRALAEAKARAGARRVPGAVVLGSDTLIALDEAVIGKPASADDAFDLLARLRGRRHAVYTAVSVGPDAAGRFETQVERSGVWMRRYTDAEIRAYLAQGESLDKAGAYAIQGAGAALVERIEGDFTAVVGLPLRLTAALLAAHGVSIPADIGRLYRERPLPNWTRFAAS